ncbi:hypothetical protein I602_348 [Polaribacter dokdonensis DSW-5]|uniref:Uncharacterized protein n=1 Tax=Polaribacter dokdonensis DSW-5 TaxID=1300348 RepID=A0A0N0CET1_9FLAO|nr:hypothetical protein I602_348 [Polaribacter dokdonensis DSW-5]
MAIITKKLTAKLIKFGSSSVNEVRLELALILTTIKVAAKANTASLTLSSLFLE